MVKKLIVPIKEEEKILEQARELFSTMQKSWWEFAKLIYAIKEGETYKVKGFDTFKDYCEADYAEVNYKTVLKFCTIVESWGKHIESKIAKDSDYRIPAYEACYAVISVKDGSLPKEDVDKLKRDVLERKLSYHRLREKMKELLDSKRKETKDFVKKSSDDIKRLEDDLTSQIDDEDEEDTTFSEDADSDAEPLFDSFDEGELEDLSPEDFESNDDALVAKTTKHTKDLSETLKILGEKVDGMKLNKKIRSLAVDLDSLNNNVNDVLTIIEEMQ